MMADGLMVERESSHATVMLPLSLALHAFAAAVFLRRAVLALLRAAVLALLRATVLVLLGATVLALLRATTFA